MAVLVIAENTNDELKDATLSAVTAAQAFGGDVHVLVAGAGCAPVADQAAKIAGVAKVLLADDPAYDHGLAEALSALVISLADGYDQLVTPAGTMGKNFMPRVAAALDVAQVSEAVAIVDANTFKRPIYAGNAIATVKSSDAKKVVTIRPTSFDKAPAEGGSAAVEPVAKIDAPALSSFISQELNESDRPDLSSADVIISGGRALGSAENFEIIERLADKLGAAVGASRAAVDAGFVPNDYQVGQTGKIVAPKLYIAVGISGAIQHLAGMKDSKIIVAINKDEEAPIFQVADYGLVADLFEAVPELEKQIG
ncbi:electron transfer flavoprotein subunit alpha [Rhodothalassium salexigens]|uniref:electron transfer flavoprotein subunit alpha/FixB family protein n=1 Tax=Rhodothalassium salexigens TaxID=1086 RepID=UPI001912E653|nr:FAD-binding protein [Rhodothalassium salexigens]MBK5911312.1 electron transfer flavoprotein subunit alpha [Rhodothalassium salexigens]